MLSRELAERRIFPAIDLVASATRREELLLSEEALAVSRLLRQRIAGMPAIAAMNDLTDRHETGPHQRRAGADPGRRIAQRTAAVRLARSNSFMNVTSATTALAGTGVVDAGPHPTHRPVALEPIQARAWWPRR